jgi:apolipoprotein N-acyltransferase
MDFYMGLLKNDYGWALLAGLSCMFGFAPFGIFPIPLLALAVLFTLWQRAATPGMAAGLGWSFGLGLLSACMGGIYIAIHVYGDMPWLLALLATLLFAAFCALLPAWAGYLQARFSLASRPETNLPGTNWCAANCLRLTLIMPAMWVLFEWVRGLLFTGFPWLTLGYSQSNAPLAGYAPVFGVFGVSLLTATSSGLLSWLLGTVWRRTELTSERSKRERGGLALSVLLLLWIGGALLRTVTWTQVYGEPFSVALVQGNIAQNLKFNEDALVGTLETYRRLVAQNETRLTVLPETALPMLRHEVPPTLVEQLRNHGRQNKGDVLIGSFERDQGGYYNSVFTLGAADEQHYRKQHLVPFGEFIPLRPLLGWFINGVLNIPMGDLVRGDAQQAPLNVAGQRVAANICYEDVFGEEIIRALPQATLLVNFTNDAWYGDSAMAAQHNQISQLRALESGRMMLRATNTGVTSIIGVDGKILQQLPQHVEAVLLGMAQGYVGSTPYVRWGNAAVLLLIAAMLGGAWWQGKRVTV